MRIVPRVRWDALLLTVTAIACSSAEMTSTTSSGGDPNVTDGGTDLDGTSPFEDASATSDAGKDASDAAKAKDGSSGSDAEGAKDAATNDGEAGTSPVTLEVAEVAVGGVHSCARFESGAIKCWGAGSNTSALIESLTSRGRAASDMGANLPFIKLGAGRSAKQLSLKNGHACVVLDNDKVKCWGSPGVGTLGIGSPYSRFSAADMGDNLPYVNLGTGRTVKSVSTGMESTCAIMDDDSVKCWGRNDTGQLGIGSTTSAGISLSTMGDNLPTVSFGAGRTVKSIDTAGGYNLDFAGFSATTCAILDNGGVKCFGSNAFGKLGLGIAARTAKVGAAAGEMGDALAYVNLGTGRTAKAISVSGTHVCAILDNDKLKCWGYSVGYQESNVVRGTSPSEMGDALPYIDVGGLGVKRVRATNFITCAQLADESIKCWGYNQEGHLGLEDTTPRGYAAGTMGTALPAVKLGTTSVPLSFAHSGGHACVAFTGGRIKCWGRNDDGVLGLGITRASVGNQAGDMGAGLPYVALE